MFAQKLKLQNFLRFHLEGICDHCGFLILYLRIGKIGYSNVKQLMWLTAGPLVVYCFVAVVTPELLKCLRFPTVGK